MRFTNSALLVLAGHAAAQHVHLDIPEVSHYISAIESEFSAWYHGPRPTIPHPTHPPNPFHSPAPSVCAYWLEDIKHQGIAAFNPSPSTYQVFRNVKDFGAKGDGVTDDTAAIQAAISSGGRCAPGSCSSTTTTPAIVYFPAGTYMISSSIIDYYYTQIIGNPNCVPTIKASANYTGTNGLGLIDGDKYGANGLGFGATNVFYRQIRNFVIDTTLVPANESVTGIHWPTAQATSLQFITFNMSQEAGTQHQGVFIESGSGGFIGDLTFYGGLYGIQNGNQQFTQSRLTFKNVVTAINQLWDWGWLYQGITIENCSVGINMSSGGSTAQSVGSVVLIDSTISNTPLGIVTAHSETSQPPAGGSLILENVALNNVPVAVQGAGGVTALSGSTGSTIISAWGEGHEYTPNGPKNFEGTFSANARPGPLLSGSKYYSQAKPQYEKYPVSAFVSARSAGATGDGHTDDTGALQAAVNLATVQGKIMFLDHGDYKITRTLNIPAGARIVGESYSVIFSSGEFFNNINSSQPVLRVGLNKQWGRVELSDMIISTQGPQAGAVLIEHNLAAPPGNPSGYWDVHTRIGGFAGSDLQLAECPTTPNVLTPPAPVNTNCIAAYMSLHITSAASGFYMENNWLWVADHDIDDPNLTQLTIYAGRGLLDESSGPVWLVGTAVEHHTKYQYQFSSAANVFAGFIQTETPYYQPNPPASEPFPYVASLNDPYFAPVATAVNLTASNTSIPTEDAWGLRIVNSNDILIYGAGHYSFFDNYSTNCSDQGNGEITPNTSNSLIFMEDYKPQQAIEATAAPIYQPKTMTISETRSLPTWRLILLVISLCIGLFLSLLDTSIVATALYDIGVSFSASHTATWVALSYTLSYLSFAVPFANLSDVIGRRAAWLLAFTIFFAFSLACGFARTLVQLIGFRAVQGVGGSGLYSLTMIVLPEVVEEDKRKWIGAVVGVVVAVAGVMGPVVGGVITRFATWRWVFWINGPVAAVSVALFLLTWPAGDMIKQPVRLPWRRLDFPGSFLLIAASVLVVFAFQEAGLRPSSWDKALFLAPLLVGCFCWCTLFAWEFLAPAQSISVILPPRLLKRRIYIFTVMITILTGFVNFSAIYALPLHFQIVNGTSSLVAGVALLPLLVSAALGSMAGGFTSKHRAAFPALAVANGLMAIGAGLLSTLTQHHGVLTKTYGFEVPLGLGIGLSISTSTLLAAVQCEAVDVAVAQGVVAQARVLGGSIGIAASSAILGSIGAKATRMDQVGDERLVYVKGFSKTMWVCAIVACIAVVLSAGTYQKEAGRASRSSASEQVILQEQEVAMPKEV
ncbi:glycoside hydrolase family 55 protein, partial [Aureobasidium melanogenum]